MSSPGKKDLPPLPSKESSGQGDHGGKGPSKRISLSVNASNITNSAAATLGSTETLKSTPETTVPGSVGSQLHTIGDESPIEQAPPSPRQAGDLAFTGGCFEDVIHDAYPWSTPTPMSVADVERSARGSIDSRAGGDDGERDLEASGTKKDEPEDGLQKPESK